MPKSSSAMRTPMARSWCRMASAASSSRISTASVISSSSRLAGRPEAASAATTFSASVPLLNCTGETLTARRISSGQVAASVQAVVSTHSPSWLIRPVSSAIGMNSAGEIMPRSRMAPAQQRLAAGDAVVLQAEAGLVVNLEAAVGDGLAQVHLQDAAGADLRRPSPARRSDRCGGRRLWRRTSPDPRSSGSGRGRSRPAAPAQCRCEASVVT